MSSDGVPDDVRQLLGRHLPSMDHIALLVALHSAGTAIEPAEMATATRLTPSVTSVVLADLVAARLVIDDGSAFRLDRSSSHARTVDLVVELYNAKPVTLVRAVYDRPSSAARSFADAFRIRKPGD